MSNADRFVSKLTGQTKQAEFPGDLHVKWGQVDNNDPDKNGSSLKMGGETSAITGVRFNGFTPEINQPAAVLQQGATLLGLGYTPFVHIFFYSGALVTGTSPQHPVMGEGEIYQVLVRQTTPGTYSISGTIYLTGVAIATFTNGSSEFFADMSGTTHIYGASLTASDYLYVDITADGSTGGCSPGTAASDVWIGVYQRPYTGATLS